MNQLIEFIELNSMMGITEFTFYLAETVDQIRCLLQSYSKFNSKVRVTVLKWNLPFYDIWYRGQLSAVNDCLYRVMYKNDHVLFIDLDEFIVLKNFKKIPDFLR